MIEHILPLPKNPKLAQRITIHFDGLLSEAPPPPLAWSFVVYVDGIKQYDAFGVVPSDYGDSPAVAKFYALKEALQFLNNEDRFNDHIVFSNEDPMVINTMSRLWSCPENSRLRALWADCVRIAAPFANIKYVWITKMQNREARDLTIRAFKDAPRAQTA